MTLREFEEEVRNCRTEEAGCHAVFDRAHSKWCSYGRRMLTEGELTLICVETCFGEVCNGGIDQYLDNESGRLARYCPDALRRADLPEYAEILAEALSRCDDCSVESEEGELEDYYIAPWVEGSQQGPLEDLDSRFFELYHADGAAFRGKLYRYILAHEREFAVASLPPITELHVQSASLRNQAAGVPVQYRVLGRSGLRISALSFGAGPVSTLLVGDDRERQTAVIEHAIRRGINWFDTAATYGNGLSEQNLGRALDWLGALSRVHVATKVRLTADDLQDIRSAVYRSLERSLTRLRLDRVVLLQLHNSITRERGDEPTSITPADVLGRRGVIETFQALQAEGLVRYLGLTGIGHPTSLADVVRSRQFDTMQAPYHLLNPSAGRVMDAGFTETNYGNIIADCAEAGMGVLAIRALAGGALANCAPSPHTLKTPFFPLDLYERDRQRAARLQERIGPGRSLPQEAVRFALAHPQIHSVLIGFASEQQIDQAIEALKSDLPPVTCEDW